MSGLCPYSCLFKLLNITFIVPALYGSFAPFLVSHKSLKAEPQPWNLDDQSLALQVVVVGN
jgi:hypothetical protein